MLAVTNTETVSYPSPNIFNVIKNREYGIRKFEEKYIDDTLVRNIKNNQCTKRIIDTHEGYIVKFSFQDFFAATLSRRTLKLRDMITEKYLWTFTPEPQIYWTEIIKITDGKIICSGSEKISNKPEYSSTIRIIDFQTGKQTAAITDKKLEENKVCMVGKRIFSAYVNGDIGEWDLEGKLIRLIPSDKLNDINSRFLASEFFLVHLDNDKIVIHDIEKNEKKICNLKFEKSSIPNISAATINGSNLICGFNKYTAKDMPDCCIIDLKSGKITDEYIAKGDFFPLGDRSTHEGYLNEWSSIKKIIVHNDWIFLGRLSGTIIAVNFAKRMHKVLGAHSMAVQDLAIDGEILISSSDRSVHVQEVEGEIKLWDLKTLEKISEMQLPVISKTLFVSGKALAAVENTLLEWDFLIPPKVVAEGYT